MLEHPVHPRRLRAVATVIAAVLGILALLPLSAGVAQEEEEVALAALFEVTGFVEVLEDDLIVVEGIVVAPADAFLPADLKVGDAVTVLGILTDDGTLIAISLELVTDLEEDDLDEVGDELEEEVEEPAEDDSLMTCVGADPHRVAKAIADHYELDYETVIGWHCDGFGFGDIAIALKLAEEMETDVEDLLAQFAEGTGWGVMMKEAGIHPSALALGRIISARSERLGPPDHAGRPDDVGPPDHAGKPEQTGKPDHAGPKDNTGPKPNPGPPPHANSGGRGRP